MYVNWLTACEALAVADSKLERGANAGRKAARRAAIALVAFALVGLAIYALQPADLYLWAKALHVIAVISWMAGLLYMPRLFIYHFDSEPGSTQSETFKVMEQRLYNVIMRPAMILSWVLGLYLAWSGFGFMGGWLHVKIAAVVALSAVHEYYGRAIREFAGDARKRSARYWRLMNEVPTLLMILIVIMVIVKPI